MATPRDRSTAIHIQPVAGDPVRIDPDPIQRPIEDDEPAAIAERAWLERDSMAAPVDYRSVWAFYE
jgi:hypothetical protein